jgi:hypothetical protein
MFDGQASAFASVSSIVYGVLNGFVMAAERVEQERLEQEKEKAANAEDLDKALEIEQEAELDNKKGFKKKSSK